LSPDSAIACKYLNFYQEQAWHTYAKLGANLEENRYEWMEIITVRSIVKTNRQLIDELLRQLIQQKNLGLLPRSSLPPSQR